MAVPARTKQQPKWVIDTHGMHEVLTTTKNRMKACIIDAIENGEMVLLKPVSEEIKKLYPHLWPSFHAIKNKKYVAVDVSIVQMAATMTEEYGSSILGSIPLRQHFEAIAAARLQGCKLVTSGKALANCKRILHKCSNFIEDVAVSVDFVAGGSA